MTDQQLIKLVSEGFDTIALELDALRDEMRNPDKAILKSLGAIIKSQQKLEGMLLDLTRTCAQQEQDIETHKRHTAEQFQEIRKKLSNGRLAPAGT